MLAHSWARSPGEPQEPRGHHEPRRVCLMMHGILGSKSNWNTPAKRLLHQVGHMGWQVLQIDHRAHGQSPSGEPPHTLEACASDVVETLGAAGVRIGTDELVVCGHSFGGKVALALLRELLERGAPPRMTWLFDSVPGRPAELPEERKRREQSVCFVLGAVEAAAQKGKFADRGHLIETLHAEHGLAKPLAQWVAQTVRNTPCGSVALGYDLPAVRALYESYRSTCMWELLEGGHADVGVVVAGRNRHAWGEENIKRLEACQARGKRVQTVVLEKAGHNVHVDDLPGLLEKVAPTFA